MRYQLFSIVLISVVGFAAVAEPVVLEHNGVRAPVVVDMPGSYESSQVPHPMFEDEMTIYYFMGVNQRRGISYTVMMMPFSERFASMSREDDQMMVETSLSTQINVISEGFGVDAEPTELPAGNLGSYPSRRVKIDRTVDGQRVTGEYVSAVVDDTLITAWLNALDTPRNAGAPEDFVDSIRPR